jgi:carbon storage regulator CsrA
VLEINGEQVRIGITAPASLRILRKEIYTDVHAQNQAAVITTPEGLQKIKDGL